MKSYLAFFLFLLFTTFSSADLKCGDLLDEYAEKPQYLEFVKCEKGSGQTIATATYKVASEHSKEVERFLVDTYGMGELKFACCGWETGGRTGSFEHRRLKKIDASYTALIYMYGEAVIEGKDSIVERADIPYFYVIVEIVSI